MTALIAQVGGLPLEELLPLACTGPAVCRMTAARQSSSRCCPLDAAEGAATVALLREAPCSTLGARSSPADHAFGLSEPGSELNEGADHADTE